MSTILVQCSTNPLGALWQGTKRFSATHHYAGWYMGEVIWAKNETVIKWMATLRISPEITRSSDPHKWEKYSDPIIKVLSKHTRYRQGIPSISSAFFHCWNVTYEQYNDQEDTLPFSKEPTHHQVLFWGKRWNFHFSLRRIEHRTF